VGLAQTIPRTWRRALLSRGMRSSSSYSPSNLSQIPKCGSPGGLWALVCKAARGLPALEPPGRRVLNGAHCQSARTVHKSWPIRTAWSRTGRVVVGGHVRKGGAPRRGSETCGRVEQVLAVAKKTIVGVYRLRLVVSSAAAKSSRRISCLCSPSRIAAVAVAFSQLHAVARSALGI
jgi:hypothetical protein